MGRGNVIRTTSASILGEALAFEREHQLRLFGTADFPEGKLSFLEQRVPSFSGR